MPYQSRQLIEIIGTVAAWAQEKEPKTTKYAICVPRESSDETNLYVIEE
jgi:hypothetical protein